MTKAQIGTVIFAVALLFAMYWGCDRKPPEQEAVERSRSLVVESTDISVLRDEAKEALAPAELGAVLELEASIEQAVADSVKVERFKQISGKWYTLGYPAIAGFYAQQVAELDNSEEAWSIAGTTYSIAVQRAADDRTRSFATGRAVTAFENAISLNPDNPANQVNLALIYTENPPESNPMQGVQMLLELNNEYPDNVYILNNLGRLANRTGQYERAVQRLEKALSLSPGNGNTICLLAEAYRGAGQTAQATEFQERCREGQSQ